MTFFYRISLVCATIVLFATSLATGVWAESPKMKMTTPMPPGIASPDKVETRLAR